MIAACQGVEPGGMADVIETVTSHRTAWTGRAMLTCLEVQRGQAGRASWLRTIESVRLDQTSKREAASAVGNGLKSFYSGLLR